VSRRLSGLILMISVFFLAGCIQIVPATGPTTPTPVAAESQEESIVYVTATPEPVQVIIVTATPEPITATPTITPTKTSTIAMAQVKDNGNGTVYVSWNADGYFPSGFQVVWSATNTAPVYPTDSSTYISDSNARTVTFQGEYGSTYYIRVCRYENNTCDLYSNVATVTVISRPASVPYYNENNYGYSPDYYNYSHSQYFYPAPYTSSTVTPAAPAISITGMHATGYGTATIYWQATGDFPEGFMVLYSKVPSRPTYGDYPDYPVSSGSARSDSISGTPGVTYYFRVCRFNGTGCDVYSNVFTYTF